ncbi:MAG: glycosyltransferase family 39 protein [Sphaerochaetaceae bacterium]|nr:glycosyltransferase family 39 protein [Sphaerochaetaceae bacterium]
MNREESWIKNKKLLIVVGFFLIASFSFLLVNYEFCVWDTGDSLSFVQLAENFLSDDHFTFDTSRTPGYPLFLSLVLVLGGSLNTVVVVQILISAMCLILAYRICRKMGTGENMSLACAIAYGLDLSLHIYQCRVLSDVFFLDMLVITLYFLVKYYNNRKLSSFAFFSFFLNFSLLVRPILIYYNILFIILLLVLLIIRKINWKLLLTYTVLFAVLIGGWCARNYYVTGVFEFSNIRNYNLLFFDAAELRADIEGISDEQARELFREEFSNEYETNGLNDTQIRALYGEYGSKYIKAHFVQYLIKNIKGLISEFFGPNNKFLKQTIPSRFLRYPIILLYCSYLGLTYLFYAVGFFKNIKKFNFVDWFIFTVSGYCAAASASLGYSRFRVAWFALILIGVFLLVGKRKEKDN